MWRRSCSSDTGYDRLVIGRIGVADLRAFRTMMSLSDPDGANPLVVAAQWLQATMLGTVATAIAVIAVTGVGVLMLTGRLDWRRGATVVFGCFVLFGAASMAAGIRGGLSGEEIATRSSPLPPVPVIIVRPVTPKPLPGFDPYAGAAPARSQKPID
jgi:type IV secretory pathway VirB2 component (pilin)